MDFSLKQEQQAMAHAASRFEQELRNLCGLQIGDGTAQIMKMFIARQMTGHGA
jgi:hypothetical protein